jgi:NRPS condensation-like uncharacterized protein
MPNTRTDVIASWFRAGQELGEFIGIRFGRLAPGAVLPDWYFLPHTDVDGIGGLAQLLRERGAELDRLAQLKYPGAPSWWPFIRSLPNFLKPRRRLRWASLPLESDAAAEVTQPTPAVAWHVFDEAATTQIRRICRKSGVTVNSFLLKHLTKAIRPDLADQSWPVPWMVPVNLRGKIVCESDIANHSSYVGVQVSSYETVRDVHRKVYDALRRGEHWANWKAYQLGYVLPHSLQKWLIKKELATNQWFLGGFSNLGDWDPEQTIHASDCQGSWLFAPPVLSFQTVGAGCVTFHNRLSLTLQIHPQMTPNPAVARNWVNNWVKEIEMDVASLLEESVAVPWIAA